MIKIMNPSRDGNEVNKNPLKRAALSTCDEDEPRKQIKKQRSAPLVSHAHDVLSGRGGLVNKHAGNVAFRRVVEANKVTYHSVTKEHKPLLVQSIVEAIFNQSPPGRFLAQDKTTGEWYDVGKTKAIQKTSQALREGADKIRQAIEGSPDADNKVNEVVVKPEAASDTVASAAALGPDQNNQWSPERSESVESACVHMATGSRINLLNDSDIPTCNNSSTSVLVEDFDSDDDMESSEGLFNDLDSFPMIRGNIRFDPTTASPGYFDQFFSSPGLTTLSREPSEQLILEAHMGIPVVSIDDEAFERIVARVDDTIQSDDAVSVVSLDMLGAPEPLLDLVEMPPGSIWEL